MMRRIPRTFLGAFVIVTSAFAFRPLVPAPETSTAAAASTASRRRCSVWPVSRRASLWESRARRTSAGAEWEGWLALHAGRSGDGGGGLEQESLDAGEDTVSPRGDVRAEPCREIGEDVEQATDSGDAEANRERTLPRVETPHLGAGGGDAHERLAGSTGSTGTAASGGGRKIAARAAVAVVEEIRAKELEERGEAVPGWGTSTSRAKTTRGAMVEACQRANMTEARAQHATQIFVYALAGVALSGESQQEDLMQDVIVKIYSEDPDWSSTDSVDVDDPVPTPAAVEGNVRSRYGYATWDRVEPPPTIFEDELLAKLGAWNPSVANELDGMLRSKPRSTPFSRLALESFESWVEAFFIKPAKVSPAVAAGLSLFQRLDSTLTMVVKAAFDEASGVIPSALLLAEGDEVKFLKRQSAIDAAGEAAFAQLGEPKNDLILGDDVVDRFVDKVVPGLVSVSERVSAACGLTFLRCQSTEEGVTAHQLYREMRSRLDGTGLDAEVKVFLMEDGIQRYDKFIDMATQMGKLDAGDSDGVEDLLSPGLGDLLKQGGDDQALLIMLVPANTEPLNKPFVGEVGLAFLALMAPISLFLFCTEAFGLDSYEVVQAAIKGDPASLLKAGMLWFIMAGLFGVRESARFLLANKAGIRLGYPRALPSPQTGLLSPNTVFKSYPKSGKDLFDTVMAGPVVGLVTSSAALVMGLHMTADAVTGGGGGDTLAGFPTLPSGVLQGSFLMGSVVDFFLRTNLGSGDIAASQIAMHPLAVAGIASTLWNAASVLPLQGSDGKAAIDAIDSDSLAVGIAGFIALVFAGVRSFGDNGDFLATVLLTATFAFPQSNPIIREDNVTTVRDPLRLLLALLVGAVSMSVLLPMTVTSFLAPGAMSIDTGAGAESVAAGLGVGGICFGGVL